MRGLHDTTAYPARIDQGTSPGCCPPAPVDTVRSSTIPLGVGAPRRATSQVYDRERSSQFYTPGDVFDAQFPSMTYSSRLEGLSSRDIQNPSHTLNILNIIYVYIPKIELRYVSSGVFSSKSPVWTSQRSEYNPFLERS